MKELKSNKHKKRVTRNNKIAKVVITAGGYGIIISIVAILLFLIYKSYPLAFDAVVEEIFRGKPGTENILLAGVDKYEEVKYLVKENGEVDFYSFKGTKILQTEKIPLKEDEKIIKAVKGSLRNETIALVTDKSNIITLEIKMLPSYSGDERSIISSLKIEDEFATEDSGSEINKFTFAINEDGFRYYGWTDQDDQVWLRIYDNDEEEYYSQNLTENIGDDKLTNFVFSHTGEMFICGTESGELFWFDISDAEEASLVDNWKGSDNEITALAFLLGDNSLVIGDSDGNSAVWFPVRTTDGVFKFSKIHEFDKHEDAVTDIYVSSRNRAFLTIDESGEVFLCYSTTDNTSLKFKPSEDGIRTASFSPKSDAIIVADNENRVGLYSLDDKHPEVTFKTLFYKVWYEGYPAPDFVWQSTGGSDEFEPKMSLIPLIFGTLKGTFYAMLFSVPLALLAAIYVSQFAPKKFAQIIKPTVEIMAALPSVVIGFLAGLYFSPLFEKNLMSLFILLVLLPVFFLISIFAWKAIPDQKKIKLPGGSEMIFIIPFMVIAFIITVLIAGPVENTFFNGSINQWMFEALNQRYDQRNSFVVGFALGFAVIPIIFTISEDALSNVPKSLTSAALALGASRWQTVKRIVIPAAAGGIFAAIMLGLGRAIGETMIVLMATGNTPVMDMSPFNGFRAMSATIAVEIPEAPVDGSLYRVLFLTALLLFIFTFAINSVSALIGDRLRKKYARF